MDDARPLNAGDAAPRLAVAVRQERVDERAARMTGRRVDDEPRRLVDDQQVRVLVDDPQGDLGRRLEIEDVWRPSEISFWT